MLQAIMHNGAYDEWAVLFESVFSCLFGLCLHLHVLVLIPFVLGWVYSWACI